MRRRDWVFHRSGGVNTAYRRKRCAAETSGLIKPFVFVVPRDATVDAVALEVELMRHAERFLPSHERPREIRIVAELPRTATGKLQRFKLKEYVHPHA